MAAATATAADYTHGATMPVNPWAVLLNATQAIFTPSADEVPSGFRRRLVVLMAIVCLALIGAFIQAVLVGIDVYRRGRTSFWAFRLISRPGGRYIVTNLRLVSCAMTVINLGITLGYLLDLWFYTNGHGNRWSGVWRAVGPVFLGFQVNFLTWGPLQAYLVSPAMTFALAYQPYGERTKVKPLVSARFVNFAFLVLPAVIALPFVVVSFIAAGLYSRLWSLSDAMVPELRLLQNTFNASVIDMEQSTKVLLDVAQFQVLSRRCFFMYRTEYALGNVVIVGFIVVILWCWVLTRLVRRQARHLFNQPPTITFNTELTQIATTASDSTLAKSEHPFVATPVDVTKFSRAELRRIAGKASQGMLGQKAKTMLELLQAERDMLFTVYGLGFVAVLTLIFGLWVEIKLYARPYRWNDASSWSGYELLSTGLPWCTSLLFLYMQPYLIRAAYIDLLPASIQDSRRQSITLRDIWHRPSHAPPAVSGPGGMVRVIVEQSVTEDYKLDGSLDGINGYSTTIEAGREFEFAFGEAPPIPVASEGQFAVGDGLGPSVGWTKPDWAGEDEVRHARGLSVSRGSVDAGKGLFPPNQKLNRPSPLLRATPSRERMPTISTLDDVCIPWEWKSVPPTPGLKPPSPTREGAPRAGPLIKWIGRGEGHGHGHGHDRV